MRAKWLMTRQAVSPSAKEGLGGVGPVRHWMDSTGSAGVHGEVALAAADGHVYREVAVGAEGLDAELLQVGAERPQWASTSADVRLGAGVTLGAAVCFFSFSDSTRGTRLTVKYAALPRPSWSRSLAE